MRGSGRMVAVALGLCIASAAQAQAPTGPLAPSDAPPSVAKPPKRSAHRAKTVPAKRGALPASARIPSIEKPAAPVAEPVVAGNEGRNPLSLGMKWNGSNDNAAQTRIENLNGQATGTGAEVGVKLHF